jgi:hypothetical protein
MFIAEALALLKPFSKIIFIMIKVKNSGYITIYGSLHSTTDIAGFFYFIKIIYKRIAFWLFLFEKGGHL